MALLDPLCCQEESLELEEERKRPMLALLEEPEAVVEEEEWAEVLCSLAAKDEETRPELLPSVGGDDAYRLSLRREVVEWVVRAAASHDFSVVTTFLAVNYLDRCFLPHAAAGGLRLQRDKVWMGRLAAVAALSLAAKVEETQVPLLLDLQVPTPPGTEENRYVFEAKTIRRMELLLLSALRWRMNSVTPLSFIHHLLPRLCSISTTSATSAARVQDLLGDSEAALLSVVAGESSSKCFLSSVKDLIFLIYTTSSLGWLIEDWRWVRYPASVWAAAALLHAAEGGAGAVAATALVSQETHHLISLLNVPKVWLLRLNLQEKVEECYQLIMESMVYGGGLFCHKRKHCTSSSYYSVNYSSPHSPNWVIGSCFSCKSPSSGGDSWATHQPSASPSPENRPSKKMHRQESHWE
ncbi:hypothetical protein GW17_00004204 [Ensete ventricosum]|nr:hypothetical protein GW17_00004204 [Ensete ventricosum]RZR85157.1 hypothetical protein BHM03_00012107 [Ensete ventricosum]